MLLINQAGFEKPQTDRETTKTIDDRRYSGGGSGRGRGVEGVEGVEGVDRTLTCPTTRGRISSPRAALTIITLVTGAAKQKKERAIALRYKCHDFAHE